MKTITLLLLATTISYSSFAVPPTISGFSPVSAASGMTVTITGTDFTGATAVSFGGTAAASFTVVSSTQITAVVAGGTSGQVRVTTADGAAFKTGFTYMPVSGIIGDFGGYWSTTGALPNAGIPDNSNNLLAFTYNGVTYSTGVNNAVLTNHSITYTSGVYKALPVAGIEGVTAATSTYLAIAKKIDGSAGVAYTPAVSDYTIKKVLTDGINGLDLGTGVTNLPTTAIMTFIISNINPSSIADAEPDIILTQIAAPATGNDQYSFIDASGNVIGNTISQNMTLLPYFGTYGLDLFNLSPNTPYNTATAYSVYAANNTREIRLTALRLSDFGITAGNVSLIKALKITPSGNSDYAFIAYNANAINLAPNVTRNLTASNTNICNGGTATLSVIAAAVNGGTLSYQWEESSNTGTTWAPVIDGGNYSGATTNELKVVNAGNGYKYRVVVQEVGNIAVATGADFTISIIAPTAPSSVTIASAASTCLNTPVQLTSAVTGGSNLFYQWQSNASGSYTDIPDATLNNYIPPVNQTGAISYRLQVSSGSGCGGSVTSTPVTVTVTGVSSVTNNATCGSGSLTLSATATSGTIDWYTTDAGGSPVFSGNSFTTPVLTATTTYYVSASGCTSALRVPVTATIYPVTAGGSVSGGKTVMAGVNSTTLTLSGQTGSVLNWQSSTDNFNTSVSNIADTANQLIVTNLTQTTEYRATIKSGSCAIAYSALATIIVDPVIPVPIRTGSLKAIRSNNSIRLQWTAYEQQSTVSYEVERSADGILFTKLASIQPVDINNPEVGYQWLDNYPLQGYNFYRIKIIYISGTYDYTSSVKLLFENSKQGISCYPNPLRGREINLQFNNMTAGVYQMRLINNIGETIFKTSLMHSGGYRSQKLTLPANLNGIYHIEMTAPSGEKNNTSILIL